MSCYNYGESAYWDARYTEEADSSFDWYQRYSALRPFLRNFVPLSSCVLMVGCGNSRLNIFSYDCSTTILHMSLEIMDQDSEDEQREYSVDEDRSKSKVALG